MSDISNIAVVGGGLMGAGIAQVFASAGYDVTVFEPSDAVLGSLVDRIAANIKLVGGDESAVARITGVDTLVDAVSDADYVTEAAPEKLELKQSIFRALIKAAPRHAILASNSSVIPVGRIAAGLDTAERIVGTHWWNPPYLIPLVEVVQAKDTAPQSIVKTMDLLRGLGKEPAHVKKDVPGFVANRLQHALWREAIAMVAEGICDARTLDTCVKNSFGLRLPVLGPLENADLVGIDLTLDIHKTIIPELDRSSGPNPYLNDLIDAGRLGFKTGAGFRDWTEQEIDDVTEHLTRYLVNARNK